MSQLDEMLKKLDEEMEKLRAVGRTEEPKEPPAIWITKKPRQAVVVPVADTTQNTPTLEQCEHYARRLVAYLYNQYGKKERRTEVTHRRNAVHYYFKGTRDHLIRFGQERWQYILEHGFNEYDSLTYLVPPQRQMRGLRGIYQEVLHEFAHVLQTEIPGGRTHNSVHNETFVECYQELLDLVPFGETIPMVA